MENVLNNGTYIVIKNGKTYLVTIADGLVSEVQAISKSIPKNSFEFTKLFVDKDSLKIFSLNQLNNQPETQETTAQPAVKNGVDFAEAVNIYKQYAKFNTTKETEKLARLMYCKTFKIPYRDTKQLLTNVQMYLVKHGEFINKSFI